MMMTARAASRTAKWSSGDACWVMWVGDGLIGRASAGPLATRLRFAYRLVLVAHRYCRFVEFGILGPLEVRAGGQVVALGGVKPRAVLAVLALNANRPVSAERLAV